MSILQSSLVAGALRAVGSFHPEYAGFINTVLKYAPQIDKIGPVITAGIKEGPGALAAAEKQAPELAHAIREFVATASPATTGTVDAKHAENAAREMFGHPSMTPDEEKAWMDRASPISDSSTSGSG